MSNESENKNDKIIDRDKYKGHTPAPWETNSEDSQSVWQEHDENIPRHIAMAHSDQNWEDMSETEFMRMMANKMLIADAPLILQAYDEKCREVERLREGIRSYLNLELSTQDLKELIE